MAKKLTKNQKWWTYRSHESQALNDSFFTKEADEQRYLDEQTQELKRINEAQKAKMSEPYILKPCKGNNLH
jgi:hypothetical protein